MCLILRLCIQNGYLGLIDTHSQSGLTPMSRKRPNLRFSLEIGHSLTHTLPTATYQIVESMELDR